MSAYYNHEKEIGENLMGRDPYEWIEGLQHDIAVLMFTLSSIEHAFGTQTITKKVSHLNDDLEGSQIRLGDLRSELEQRNWKLDIEMVGWILEVEGNARRLDYTISSLCQKWITP